MAHPSHASKAHIAPSGGFDPVLNVAHAAAFIGVSVATLKRAGARGEIKILKLSPRRLGVRTSEANRFLETREARA